MNSESNESLPEFPPFELPRSTKELSPWTGQWYERPVVIDRGPQKLTGRLPKYPGTYRVYYVGEDKDIPKYTVYRKNHFPLVGDYLCDNFGVVAQVLMVGLWDHPQYKIARARLYTPFGVDSLNAVGIEFLRDRASYSGFSQESRVGKFNKYLTYKDKAFLMLLMARPDDPYAACGAVYGINLNLPRGKYLANKKMTMVLTHPETGTFMSQRLHELLQSQGITAGTWVKKLVESTKKELYTPTHFNMWMVLGKFIPEIREALSEGDTSSGKEVPGFKTNGEIQDAQYRDVCKVCGGEGTYKAPVNGDVVTLPCPLCAKRIAEGNAPASDEKVSSVQNNITGLRV